MKHPVYLFNKYRYWIFWTRYILSGFFFSSKCSLFHNSNAFGSCIINILYIYSTNIGTEYFKHGIYFPGVFFSSKCSLFHNSNAFGSCIINISYAECAKIKQKIIPAPKGISTPAVSHCFSNTKDNPKSHNTSTVFHRTAGTLHTSGPSGRKIKEKSHQEKLLFPFLKNGYILLPLEHLSITMYFTEHSHFKRTSITILQDIFSVIYGL